MLYNCAELASALLNHLLLKVIYLWWVVVVSCMLKYFIHSISILILSITTAHLFSLGGSYSEVQDPDSMTQTSFLGSEGIESSHCYCPQTSKESPQWLTVSMAHILGLDTAEKVVIIKLFLTPPLQYAFLRVPALSF